MQVHGSGTGISAHGAIGSHWELLGAIGSHSEPLGAIGSHWEPLEAMLLGMPYGRRPEGWDIQA